jgi:hypothetical protein
MGAGKTKQAAVVAVKASKSEPTTRPPAKKVAGKKK